MNPTWVTAAAAVAGLAAGGCLWALRHIVRDELLPLRQDIEVLRMAVFNHLTHGEAAQEDAIRRRLGYGPRS